MSRIEKKGHGVRGSLSKQKGGRPTVSPQKKGPTRVVHAKDPSVVTKNGEPGVRNMKTKPAGTSSRSGFPVRERGGHA